MKTESDLPVVMKVKPSGLGTDADVARWARNYLSWSSCLPNGPIRVVVEAGWITLSGDVEWQFQRQAATDDVRHLSGVVGVTNRVAVRAPLKANFFKCDLEAALRRRALADAETSRQTSTAQT